jgi:signal transduction histidine kinase
LGKELRGTHAAAGISAEFRVSVEGTPRDLDPILRDDIYRIAREAVSNAFRHAKASKIEADILYDEKLFQLRIRDDGNGMDSTLRYTGRPGHWGLAGMRERAQEIGGELDVWSEIGAGAEVELRIPGSIAYGRPRSDGGFPLFRS